MSFLDSSAPIVLVIAEAVSELGLQALCAFKPSSANVDDSNNVVIKFL